MLTKHAFLIELCKYNTRDEICDACIHDNNIIIMKGKRIMIPITIIIIIVLLFYSTLIVIDTRYNRRKNDMIKHRKCIIELITAIIVPSRA